MIAYSYKFVIVLFINIILTFTCFAENTNMSSNETKKFIQDVMSNVIENMNATEETYSQYFSKDYRQYVDGKILNYNDFVAHMKAQKNAMQSLKATIKYIVVEGDKVATVHIINGIKKNKTIIKAQVNALFEIKDHKIVLCNELTHLIEGEESDRDLGSRH